MVVFYRNSRLFLSQHGRFYAVSFETPSWDTQTLNWSRNVSKFYAWQVVSGLMNEEQSQILLPKQTRSLLFATSWSRKVKNSNSASANLRVFASNISSLRLKRRYTRYGFVSRISPPVEQRNIIIHFFFVVHVEWTACVQRNLKVCINKEPLLWSL